MKTQKLIESLKTWTGTNEMLRGLDEEDAEEMMKFELRGKKRETFLLRIHSRLNYLRAHRERAELIELSKK